MEDNQASRAAKPDFEALHIKRERLEEEESASTTCKLRKVRRKQIKAGSCGVIVNHSIGHESAESKTPFLNPTHEDQTPGTTGENSKSGSTTHRSNVRHPEALLKRPGIEPRNSSMLVPLNPGEDVGTSAPESFNDMSSMSSSSSSMLEMQAGGESSSTIPKLRKVRRKQIKPGSSVVIVNHSIGNGGVKSKPASLSVTNEDQTPATMEEDSENGSTTHHSNVARPEAPPKRLGIELQNGSTRVSPSPGEDVGTSVQRPLKELSNISASSSSMLSLSKLTLGNRSERVRVKVTSRSSIRNFGQVGVTKKVFSANVADATGDARVVCFGTLCDSHFENFTVNSINDISHFVCRLVDKRYSTTESDFEILLNNSTKVIPLTDVGVPIKKIVVSYENITSIMERPASSVVNVCGVMLDKGQPKPYVSKNGKSGTRQDLRLIDESKQALVLTLWDNTFAWLETDSHPVLFVAHARTNLFNGRIGLGTTINSIMEINLDHTRTSQLQAWWQTQSEPLLLQYLASRESDPEPSMDFASAKQQLELLARRHDAAPLTFWNRAELAHVYSDNLLYAGCAVLDCKKKLTDMGGGKLFCPKCNITTTHSRKYFALQVAAIDDTEEIRCTIFDEPATELFGHSAEELSVMSETKPEEFLKCLEAIKCKPVNMRFSCRKLDGSVTWGVSKITMEDHGIDGPSTSDA